MGNFEKLGILVIIVLVVVIIVVAAFGTRPSTPGEDGSVALNALTRGPDDREEGSGSDEGSGDSERGRGSESEAGRGADDRAEEAARRRAEAEREAERRRRAAEEEARRTPPPQTIYVVKAGDSLWSIAFSKMGKGSHWRKIAEANPGVDPDDIHAGTKLVIPTLAAPRAEVPSTTPAPVPSGGRRYKIKHGDSLWLIARKNLGKGSRWREILAANPNLNPDRLPENETILLPPR